MRQSAQLFKEEKSQPELQLTQAHDGDNDAEIRIERFGESGRFDSANVRIQAEILRRDGRSHPRG